MGKTCDKLAKDILWNLSQKDFKNKKFTWKRRSHQNNLLKNTLENYSKEENLWELKTLFKF